MTKKIVTKPAAVAAKQATVPNSSKVKKAATKKAAAAPKDAKTAGAAAEAAAAAAAAEGNQAAAAAGSSAEIDDLFGALKGKAKKGPNAGTDIPSSTDKGSKAQSKGKKDAEQGRPKVMGSKDDIFGTESAAGRKRTEEGYAIYSEAELGLGKTGGNTDKCPFDCDCCF